MNPEITVFSPTLTDGKQSALKPLIEMTWDTAMDSSIFSTDASRSQFFVLMDETTSVVLPTTFVSYDVTTNVLTLTPSGNLDRDTKFRFLVKKGVSALSGRKSILDWQWQFETDESELSATTLLAPGNGSVQITFPTLSWAAVVSTALITYQVDVDELWDFNSPTFTSTTTGLSLTPGGSFDTNKTYYWRVLAYGASVTGGIWSDVRSFWYGQALDSDISSRQFYPAADSFGVASLGWTNGVSHQASHPTTLSFTFTSIPASTYTSHVTVKSRAQIPRTDVASSYDIIDVDGSWSLSGSTITFTPSGTIAENTRYDIEILKTMTNTDGLVLNEVYKYYWSGKFSPYYVDARSIRSRFLSAEQQIPDDLINFYIHQASLEANARFYIAVHGTDTIGELLTEAIVRDSNDVKSFAIGKWVEAAATYKMLKAILIEETRNIGVTKRLGDSAYSLSADFVKGMKAALETAKEELDQWDGYLAESETPAYAQKNQLFDPRNWNFDNMLYKNIGRRDDCF